MGPFLLSQWRTLDFSWIKLIPSIIAAAAPICLICTFKPTQAIFFSTLSVFIALCSACCCVGLDQSCGQSSWCIQGASLSWDFSKQVSLLLLHSANRTQVKCDQTLCQNVTWMASIPVPELPEALWARPSPVCFFGSSKFPPEWLSEPFYSALGLLWPKVPNSSTIPPKINFKS